MYYIHRIYGKDTTIKTFEKYRRKNHDGIESGRSQDRKGANTLMRRQNKIGMFTLNSHKLSVLTHRNTIIYAVNAIKK